MSFASDLADESHGAWVVAPGARSRFGFQALRACLANLSDASDGDSSGHGKRHEESKREARAIDQARFAERRTTLAERRLDQRPGRVRAAGGPGCRARASRRFTSPTVVSRKWKIEAARAAWAWPPAGPSSSAARQVLGAAAAARGDHRDRDGVGDRPHEREVVALARAVPVHAGEQDLAGAGLGHALRPGDRVEPGRPPAAVGEDLPALRLARRGSRAALRRRSRRPGWRCRSCTAHSRDEVRVLDRRGHDRDLVGAGVEQIAHVLRASARRRRR